jgi:hypothetical protein
MPIESARHVHTQQPPETVTSDHVRHTPPPHSTNEDTHHPTSQAIYHCNIDDMPYGSDVDIRQRGVDIMRERGIDQIRWSGIDVMQQRSDDDMRWSGIDLMRWSGIDCMQQTGIDSMWWRGIDSARWRGINSMRWICMNYRYMRGIYYWGCRFDSFLPLLLSGPYDIQTSSAPFPCSPCHLLLLACCSLCIIVRALDIYTFSFTRHAHRSERFHAHQVASAGSHPSHARRCRHAAPTQHWRSPRSANAALRAACTIFSRCGARVPAETLYCLGSARFSQSEHCQYAAPPTDTTSPCVQIHYVLVGSFAFMFASDRRCRRFRRLCTLRGP